MSESGAGHKRWLPGSLLRRATAVLVMVAAVLLFWPGVFRTSAATASVTYSSGALVGDFYVYDDGPDVLPRLLRSQPANLG
jgi:hypothetical protein